jgi:hypothetical protein
VCRSAFRGRPPRRRRQWARPGAGVRGGVPDDRDL